MNYTLEPDGGAVVAVPITTAAGGVNLAVPFGEGRLRVQVPQGEPLPADTPQRTVDHLISVGLVRPCRVRLSAAEVAKAREIAGVAA